MYLKFKIITINLPDCLQFPAIYKASDRLKADTFVHILRNEIFILYIFPAEVIEMGHEWYLRQTVTADGY